MKNSTYAVIMALAISLSFITVGTAAPLTTDALTSVSISNTVSSPNLASRQLGTCIDLCSDPNFTGKCVTNVCTVSRACINLTGNWSNGLSSVRWAGDGTYCYLYRGSDCKGDDQYLGDRYSAANLYLVGFDDVTHSLSCSRRN